MENTWKYWFHKAMQNIMKLPDTITLEKFIELPLRTKIKQNQPEHDKFENITFQMQRTVGNSLLLGLPAEDIPPTSKDEELPHDENSFLEN